MTSFVKRIYSTFSEIIGVGDFDGVDTLIDLFNIPHAEWLNLERDVSLQLGPDRFPCPREELFLECCRLADE